MAKYERGLQFLIRRYVSGSLTTILMNRIVTATVAAIRAKEINADAEIAKFMRASLHYAVRSIRGEGKQASKLPLTLSDTIADLKERLEILTAEQIDALSRYYIDGERIVDICDSIKISEDRFYFWREMMRSAVNRSFKLRTTLSKPVVRQTSKVQGTRSFAQPA